MAMRLPRRTSRLRTFWIVALLAIVAGAGAYGGWYYVQQRDAQPATSVSQQPAPAPKPVKKDAPLSLFSEVPTRMVIDAIDVDAPIIPVGLDATGAMAAPATQVDVGWYDKSARVGADSKHSVLLDGHYGTDADPGVFYRLHELTEGSSITLHGGGGSSAVYKVVQKERAKLEDVDMKKAFYTYADAQQSITLITCQGEYDAQRETYDDRVVLYAVRVS